ncbi:3-dehydroquinate synthase [Actinotalea subterranea]|uniref:3-dehydroquinate synthase n=1 Tax=Actinotalea subterranea TaxID=2607497 RepID=UPI00165E780A|nr:3-dehydroquinate synthase family protein [Actinotalea subterranea]
MLEIGAVESGKTLATCESLILRLKEENIRRGDRLLAVGGGITQDLTSFVAQVYMRGLDWDYAPTTLMAMADSCIGGKSSINAGGIKNVVGGFHPPEQVFVDPAFLSSLTQSAVAAGLAEAAKIAYCRGADSMQEYLEHYDGFAANPTALIDQVLRAKKWFVEVDEYDNGERRLLNFGHTFGHAFEAAVGHSLSHGLAVAVGILCAIRHPSASTGPLVERLEAHVRELLSSAPDLPPALLRFDIATFERAFRSDKKHTASAFRLILPRPGGGVSEVETDSGRAGWRSVEHAALSAIESLVAAPR